VFPPKACGNTGYEVNRLSRRILKKPSIQYPPDPDDVPEVLEPCEELDPIPVARPLVVPADSCDFA
jgi:hypothetical protein